MLTNALPIPPAIWGPIGGERPSGNLVVRVVPEAGFLSQSRAASTLEEYARGHQMGELARALESAGQPKSYRLVHSVPVEKVLEMERDAAQTKYSPLHSLTQYWCVDLRGRSREVVARLLEWLSALPEIDAAWEQPLCSLPVVNPGDDPYNADQGYQDAAPVGIDARWAWTQPNGEGAGIGVVDVEGAWRVTHEDLLGKSPALIHGFQYANLIWENHGTAVLGEILAVDNAVGVVGSAPAISSVRMSSIYDAVGVQHVTDALVAAVAAMSVGEILLIELQIGLKPMETLDDVLDVIRLATALGITVVEAAGNGNTDLDSWTTVAGVHRLNRASSEFVDSGAILVGACVSTVPHNRCSFSNYGSRIDCFGWGQNVTTTGYGDLDNGGGNADKWYTDSFSGTSSASPIIVGAAALVQASYHAATGTFLSPGQIRALLSDPATGTAQGTALGGAIGVMPNLAAILPTLGLVADVYLRDAVGDTGVVPWAGPISISPDIIVRPSSVADPQLAYGEGSGTENSEVLGYEVESDHENYIYVRVRNRGGAPATNVAVAVYWSEVATLITPSAWHPIGGGVALPIVPIGDVLTVAPELVWPEAAVPGTGHYCFVATLDHPDDPAPTPGPLSWSDFLDMIRAHNNVTWRNFNVVNNLPDTPAAAPRFPFKVAGAEDRALPFTFEIEQRLPADAVLELEGPLGLLMRVKAEKPWKFVRVQSEPAQGKESERGRLTLPSLPRVALPEVLIPQGGRLPCAFLIRQGRERVAFGHGVGIRQIYQGEEVGRIAWRFAREPHLRREEKR